MSRQVQSVLIMLVGGVLIAITASGRFTSYVKPGFGPLLVAGGVVLLVVGALTLILAVRSEYRSARAAEGGAEAAEGGAGVGPQGAAAVGTEATTEAVTKAASEAATGSATEPATTAAAEDEAEAVAVGLTGDVHTDAHGHVHSSRAPWLIMAPVLVLLLAPPALGADAVSRASGSQAIAGVAPVADQVVTGDGGYAPNDGSGSAPGGDSSGGMVFPALPDVQNPPLALKATVLRALYDSAGSVTKRSVTVIGFITPAGKGYQGGYSIARIAISCCAADANALQLHVAGTAPYPANTWVQAVVTAIAGSATEDNNYVPSVSVTSISKIPEPSDPYEH